MKFKGNYKNYEQISVYKDKISRRESWNKVSSSSKNGPNQKTLISTFVGTSLSTMSP